MSLAAAVDVLHSSSNASDSEIAKLKYGIDDYIIKPLRPESLAALVERAKERL